MKITDKVSWVRLFNQVLGFISMLYETTFLMLNETNFHFMLFALTLFGTKPDRSFMGGGGSVRSRDLVGALKVRYLVWLVWRLVSAAWFQRGHPSNLTWSETR